MATTWYVDSATPTSGKRCYESIDEAGERRRRSHAVGRMLKRLHVRGLIVKVPHSRRWLVSRKGHQVLGAVVRLHHYGIPAAVGRAA